MEICSPISITSLHAFMSLPGHVFFGQHPSGPRHHDNRESMLLEKRRRGHRTLPYSRFTHTASQAERKVMKMFRCTLIAVIAALVIQSAIQSAWAAPGAGAKAGGQFNFYGSSSRSALSSARESSGNLRRYAESVPAMAGGQATQGGGGMAAISPIVAKEAVDSIDHAVAKSEKYLATARRQAEAAGDKEGVATVDQIGTHLAEVKKCCRDLAECCEMDAIDGKRSAACCKELEAALGKAIAAHDKLVPPPTVGQGAMPAGPHHP